MSRAGMLRSAGALLVVAGLTAGCNTSALTKRELVVYFTPTATAAEHTAALAACSRSSAQAVPEPVLASKYVSDSVGDIRFRIDHANDKEIAAVELCLGKQPGVQGFDIPDLTN